MGVYEPVAVDAVEPAELERLVATRSLSRLQREPPFIGEPRHAHLWAEVRRAMAAADAQAAVFVGRGRRPHGDEERLRALCVVRTPAWDHEHFGFVVGRVEYVVAADAAAAAAAAAWAGRALREREARMISARLPAEDLTVLSVLEDEGFRYVEHLLTPWRSWHDWQPRAQGVSRPAEPDDLPVLRRIARATFRTDRFHRDRRFAAEAADGVYAKWIDSWHADPPPGARSRVLVVDGRVCGFFMYRFFEPEGVPGRTVTDLVLGGIAPEVAGRGLGFRFYCDVMDDAAAHTDYGRVTVVTANVAVVNLYAKLGFRLSAGGEVTLHRWTG